MRTPSKTRSRFEQLLSEIYARKFSENNQQLYIDDSNQDQIKTSLSVKNEVALTFMCSIIKIVLL